MKLLIVLAAVVCTCQALTPNSYISGADQERLRQVFDSAPSDLAGAYYAFAGLKLLGGQYGNAKAGCDFVNNQVDVSSVESIFYAAKASQALAGCSLSADAGATLSGAIKVGTSSADLFYAVGAMKALGQKVDGKAAKEALQAAVKADDSALSHAYTFHAAAELGGDVAKFVENVEDAIAQADEVDGKLLQFEGGIFVTSFVVDGAYRLGAAAKKAPTITEDKVVKFANYLLGRKHIQQLKGAFYLVSAVKTLVSNKFHVPVAVTMASQVAVNSDNPSLKVRVTDLMGNSLGDVGLIADSAKHLSEDAVVISKKPFTSDAGDRTLFELNMLETKPSRGFYALSLSVAAPKGETRLVGTAGAEVTVKVTVPVAVDSMEIGIADRDQSVAAKTTKLQYPSKAANRVEADHHQKIVMKFTLRDQASNALMSAHQTFVRFENQKTGEEVVFTAEEEKGQTYKFELDLGSSAKTFGHRSGLYKMELIVGDAVIQNPFTWLLADAKLSFAGEAAPSTPHLQQYAKRPDIAHMFREPEKRPPAIVSTVFTILALVPIAIVLVLWMRLGVNISNFPMSISAIGFHVCLGGIFGLYYMYWTQLDMFATVRYLVILGLPTFIFGNRLLASIAARRGKGA